jgi:hypothetical protein
VVRGHPAPRRPGLGLGGRGLRGLGVRLPGAGGDRRRPRLLPNRSTYPAFPVVAGLLLAASLGLGELAGSVAASGPFEGPAADGPAPAGWGCSISSNDICPARRTTTSPPWPCSSSLATTSGWQPHPAGCRRSGAAPRRSLDRSPPDDLECRPSAGVVATRAAWPRRGPAWRDDHQRSRSAVTRGGPQTLPAESDLGLLTLPCLIRPPWPGGRHEG